MGLRFRKSVTLCKGVKLNFGKSGASVSFGGKGYRKTINTKGQVTTTVGLPGTGIYYTDTKPLKGGRTDRNTNMGKRSEDEIAESLNRFNQENSRQTYQLDENVEAYFSVSNSEDTVQQPNNTVENASQKEPAHRTESENSGISMADVRGIYLNCDSTVEWTEILVSSSAEELFMDDEVWAFCKDVANKVLSGDTDAYLQVIEQMRPLDDLLAYGGDFEFGTDNPAAMEVEFRVMPEDVLGREYSKELFNEYISACSIRVARDIMALLPVGEVIVAVVLNDKEILNVKFDKGRMSNVNFKGNTGMEIVEIFK